MSENEFNRRQFGKHAASALGAASLLGVAGSAADPTPEENGDPPPAIAEPIPPQPIPIELLLLEVVRQRHLDRKLNHHFLDEIRRDIKSELRRARAIREVPLTNADEPAGMFAAYRNERAGDAS